MMQRQQLFSPETPPSCLNATPPPPLALPLPLLSYDEKTGSLRGSSCGIALICSDAGNYGHNRAQLRKMELLAKVVWL